MNEEIRVVGICGSPRVDGNTNLLLTKALEAAGDQGAMVTRFDLNRLDFIPCQECGGCDETGRCIYHDDMEGIYDAIALANGVILATPIFFSTVTAQTKMMIDRFQSWWAAKYLLKDSRAESEVRFGSFICVGGIDTEKYCENALSVAKVWFVNIDVQFYQSLMYHGYDDAGAILRNTDSLKDANNLGEELVKRIKNS